MLGVRSQHPNTHLPLQMPKRREYCCCAIPIVNAGIYIALVEQATLGIVIGAVSLGTPAIVGSATPSISSLVLGIVAFVAAGVQILGFIGVWKENVTLYRRFVSIHGIITAVGFSVSAAWIIWSAVGHNNAKQRCIKDFFNSVSTDTADTLCNIFSWVTVGIMVALWLILGVVQLYLFIVLSSYGKDQRRSHEEYEGLSDPSQPLKTEYIPLVSESWGSGKRRDSHTRHESGGSISEITGQKLQQPRDAMSTTNYGYENYDPQPNRPPYPSHSHRRVASPVLGGNLSSNDIYRDNPQQSGVDYSFNKRTPQLPSI